MVKFKSEIGETSLTSGNVRTFHVSDESQVHENSDTSVREFHSTEFDNVSAQPSSAFDVKQFYEQHHDKDTAWELRQKMLAAAQKKQDESVFDNLTLEALIGVGRLYKEVPVRVNGYKFVYKIHTLKSKERKHFVSLIESVSDKAGMYHVKDVCLAYCIDSIDGISLNSFLKCERMNENDRFNLRVQFVKEMDDNLSEFLFNKFNELDAESRKIFTAGNGMQEAADAIKKSS